MSVSQLPSGRWRAQVHDRVTGRNLSVSLILGPDFASFGSRKDAEAARAMARLTLKQNPDLDFKRPKVAERWGLQVKGEPNCRNCGKMAKHLHHIVPRVRSRMGLKDWERNGLPLCGDCHYGWHNRIIDISHEILTDAEFAFATYHAGVGWIDRQYPGINVPATERARKVAPMG